MNEIWKDIPGYEGKYEVSNLGRVRSLKFNKTKILKQDTNKRGYKRVNLYKNGKKKNHWVHRLVAMAFIPNPDNLPIVNHIDECKNNNMVSNLEWCTVAYNNTYGTRTKRASESLKGKPHSEETKKKISESHKGKYKGKDHPKSKSILMYDKEGNFIRKFDCIADANEYFGKDRYCSSIACCLTGRTKTAYNYIFKYEDQNNK